MSFFYGLAWLASLQRAIEEPSRTIEDHQGTIEASVLSSNHSLSLSASATTYEHTISSLFETRPWHRGMT